MGTRSAASGITYRDSGVDIDAAGKAMARAREAIRASHGPRVLADVGSFGGLFDARGLGRNPVLVATTDGVGTKVRVAAAAGRFASVGRDLVHHCINDALVQGAEPLFFLDYVGTGRIREELVGDLITGVAEACREHGLALLGGETAEMPGVYPQGEFDLVGTLVGVVEREHILDGSRVLPGDLLFGLPSSGLHTNGYSLARRIVAERLRLEPGDPFPDANGRSVADVLLEPHRCYLETLRPILRHPGLHSLAHITGGGLPDNLPRSLGGKGALVQRGSIPSLPVFETLVRAGKVPAADAWRTFNMGVGMVLAVAADSAGEILSGLNGEEAKPFAMGTVVEEPGVAWSD